MVIFQIFPNKMKGYLLKREDFFRKLKVSEILLCLKPQKSVRKSLQKKCKGPWLWLCFCGSKVWSLIWSMLLSKSPSIEGNQFFHSKVWVSDQLAIGSRDWRGKKLWRQWKALLYGAVKGKTLKRGYLEGGFFSRSKSTVNEWNIKGGIL